MIQCVPDFIPSQVNMVDSDMDHQTKNKEIIFFDKWDYQKVQ